MMVNSTNSTLNITVQARTSPPIFLNYTGNSVPWYVSDGSIFFLIGAIIAYVGTLYFLFPSVRVTFRSVIRIFRK